MNLCGSLSSLTGSFRLEMPMSIMDAVSVGRLFRSDLPFVPLLPVWLN